MLNENLPSSGLATVELNMQCKILDSTLNMRSHNFSKFHILILGGTIYRKEETVFFDYGDNKTVRIIVK
jgi:hypothetical protein